MFIQETSSFLSKTIKDLDDKVDSNERTDLLKSLTSEEMISSHEYTSK